MQNDDKDFKPAPARPRPAGYRPRYSNALSPKRPMESVTVKPKPQPRPEPVAREPEPKPAPEPTPPAPELVVAPPVKKQPKPAKQRKQRDTTGKIPRTFFFGSIAVVLAFAAIAVYFYFQYQSATKTSTANPGNTAAEIAKKLSDTLDLPTNETPSLVAVKDKTKVQSQAFFVKAENGDQVLVYQKNGVAVLYRPSTGKVINYTVFTQNSAETTPSQ